MAHSLYEGVKEEQTPLLFTYLKTLASIILGAFFCRELVPFVKLVKQRG